MRRLACDATTQIIYDSKEGCPIAVGRETRAVPRWMRRRLELRDRECRFPGCDRTRFLHAHHMVHWADGGPTELWNLILVCPYHHRYLHENKWSVRGDPSLPNGVEFLNAGGHPYRSRRFEPWQPPPPSSDAPSIVSDVPCLS